MKHFNTLLTVMFLLVWGGNIQSAKAQNSDIDWTQNAIDFRYAVDKNVYLYNKTHNGFLNAGGKYGMQAVLNPRGIRLTLRKNGDIYYLEGPVKNESENNKGNCIGIINLNSDIYNRPCSSYQVSQYCIDPHTLRNEYLHYKYRRSLLQL